MVKTRKELDAKSGYSRQRKPHGHKEPSFQSVFARLEAQGSHPDRVVTRRNTLSVTAANEYVSPTTPTDAETTQGHGMIRKPYHRTATHHDVPNRVHPQAQRLPPPLSPIPKTPPLSPIPTTPPPPTSPTRVVYGGTGTLPTPLSPIPETPSAPTTPPTAAAQHAPDSQRPPTWTVKGRRQLHPEDLPAELAGITIRPGTAFLRVRNPQGLPFKARAHRDGYSITGPRGQQVFFWKFRN